MIYANWAETNVLATKQKGMFSVYVSNELNYGELGDIEIWNSFLHGLNKLYVDGTLEYRLIASPMIIGGMFFFETEGDAWVFYNIFTKAPIYSSSLYACLCSPITGNVIENA